MSASASHPRSDFLGGIVDRAFERAAVIAPRPVSLFEPPAAAPLPEADSEEMQAASATSASATMRAPAEPVRGEMQVSTPVPPAPAASLAHATHAATDGAPVHAAPPFAQAPAPAQTLLRETRMHTLEREIAPALLVVREAAAATSAANRSRGDAEAHALQAPTPSRARDEAQAPADPLAAPVQASLLPERTITAGFESQAAHGRRDSAPSAPAAAPPNVTISIGRVEVRAAAAPAQPAAARPAARQPMRLDEYLARKERTR